MEATRVTTVGWLRTMRRAAIPALVLAPLLAGVAWLCIGAFRLEIAMPLQLNYVEGFNVDAAARLRRGEPLYGDPSHAPFVVTVYTPGYPALVAALMRAGLPPLAAGRLLAFLSALGIAVVVGRAGRDRAGWAAIAAAAVFLLDPLVPFWQVAARPDSTAALLAVVGVIVVETGATRRRDVLAAVLFAASIFTKQSFIAAPAAVLLFLVDRNRRRAIRFAAALAAACAVAALALQRASHGWFLWHTVVGNRNPFSWGRAAELGGQFWSRHPLQILVLLVLFLAGWRSRRRSAVALWAAIASALGTVMLGKAGSDLNYLLEAIAAIALFAARELPMEWLVRRTSPSRVAAAGLAGCAIAVAATSVAAAARVHEPVAAAQAPYRELMARVAREPGIVVSDDACLLVDAGRLVHIQPFVMTQLAESGRWDQRPFLEELDTQRVRLIVAQVGPPAAFASRYTPEMRHLISTRYTVGARYKLAGEFAVLVPLEVR